MAQLTLSKRLEMVASFVPEQSRLADIGSDHAYLPIALMQRDKVNFALAGEVAKGPLEHTKEDIEASGYKGRILSRYGDGLEVIQDKDQITAITICGMGGLLISSILERGLEADKIKEEMTLILQPNNHVFELRQWLQAHHFMIKTEGIVKDAGKFYEAMVVQKGENQPPFTQEEYRFGRFVEDYDPETFNEKWMSLLLKAKKILKGLEKSQNKDQYDSWKSYVHQIQKRLEK